MRPCRRSAGAQPHVSAHYGAVSRMITHEMLAGGPAAHLLTLGDGPHRLQQEAVQAFEKIRLAPHDAGFDLQPASTFPDFSRQLAICTGNFRGERPVLEKNSQPVDISALTAAE